MPLVRVPNVGVVRFPDSMSDDDIATAIKQNILKPYPPPVDETFPLKRAAPTAAAGVPDASAAELAASGPPEAQQVVQVPTTAEQVQTQAATPAEQALSTKLETPLVKLPVAPFIPMAALASPRMALGIGEMQKEFVEGMTSPKGAAKTALITAGLANPVTAPFVGGWMAVESIASSAEQAPEFVSAVKRGDVKEASKIAANLGFNAMIALGGVKGALPRRAPLPPIIGERTAEPTLLPETKSELQKSEVTNAQTEKPPTSGIPAVQEQPAQPQAEVQAQERTAQRGGAGGEELQPQPKPQETQLGDVESKPAPPSTEQAPPTEAPAEPAVSEAAEPGAQPPGTAPAMPETTPSEPLIQTELGGGKEAQPTAAAETSTPAGQVEPAGEPSGGGVYGIAERVREQRAKAGQVEPVPPGEGISAPDSVERGRELLASGESAETAMANFEKTKRMSSDDMALARAKGEQLAQNARRIEQEKGTNSSEYQAARKELSDWDKRSKAMQTEWHKSGMAQQGETDIDTGSFTGLQRAYEQDTGKTFTPDQERVAKTKAKKSAKATAEEEAAKQQWRDHVTAAGEKVAEQQKKVSDYVLSTAEKWVQKWGEDAAAARQRLAGKFLSPTPRDLIDLATIVRFRIGELGLDVAKITTELVAEFGEGVRPYIRGAIDQAQKFIDDLAGKTGATADVQDKIKSAIKKPRSGSLDDAEQRAIDAANKAVIHAATKVADLERKRAITEAQRNTEAQRIAREAAQNARKATTEAARRAARESAKSERDALEAKAKQAQAAIDIEEQATQKALSAANDVVRKAAIDRARQATKDMEARADLPTYVWTKAREYIDSGMDNPDDIRNKLATDLGIPVKDVTAAMAKDKRAKYLADEVWKKQQVARRMKEEAKRWLQQTSTPRLQRALQNVPRIMFGLKVGFHGTVALGTHAPMVAFQPRFWKTYVRNFGDMYRMVGSPKYYEMQIQDLQRRPNYITARRAGLVNDPYVYEDYSSPDTAKYFGRLTGMGNRGYSVLKILRQDMFDQHWNQLPKTAQIPEMAEALADGINHATGVVKGRAPLGTNIGLFAPRLEASRVMWLAGDPLRAANTFLHWKGADIGEKAFALNQLKEKAWVAGTLLGALALNQGFLSAIGSNQKVNLTNPMESDYLKFKVAGMNFAYGSPMVNMAKLPAKLALAVAFRGKTSKLVLEDERVAKIIWDYARSQASPFASVALDLATGRDYAGRPLPRKLFGTLEGDTDIPKRLRMHGITEPYSWTEWASEEFTPIPIEEGLKEVWENGLGMSPQQQEQAMKALITISVMSATGGRLTDDTSTTK